MSLVQRTVKQWPLAWSLARTAHFTLQNRAIPLVEYALTGRKRALPPDPKAFLKSAYRRIFDLLRQDAENIQNGVYPAAVLIPENPLVHWKHMAQIALDGISLARRRRAGIHDEFRDSVSDLLSEFPEYYRRNFHFQTDGYFSEHSAQIYEHQVEILFGGVADPMRRLLIPLLKEKITNQGQGLRFLEIGSGTGRMTRFIKLAFPKAHITVVEPSEAYLAKSRESLADLRGIDFVRGFGEELPFKDGHFDVVYSCFLFHELPRAVREKIFTESRRVLKAGGLVGAVDALQVQDDPELEWALTQFPKDFHEPFFIDYFKNPLEDQMAAAGFVPAVLKNQGFFSKAVVAEAPIDGVTRIH